MDISACKCDSFQAPSTPSFNRAPHLFQGLKVHVGKNFAGWRGACNSTTKYLAPLINQFQRIKGKHFFFVGHPTWMEENHPHIQGREHAKDPTLGRGMRPGTQPQANPYPVDQTQAHLTSIKNTSDIIQQTFELFYRTNHTSDIRHSNYFTRH